MKKQTLWLASLFAFIALVLNIQFVLAHESITAGDYEIVYGWASEPPVAGQPNGIEIHVTDNRTGEAQPVEDVSSLIVTLSYGGQSKELEFEALGEHNPGEFQAPVLPTIPGKYTLHFGGALGDMDVDAEVEPEEVQPAETLQFPVEANTASTEQAGQSVDLGMGNWLTYLSLLVGLIALVLSVMALRRAR